MLVTPKLADSWKFSYRPEILSIEVDFQQKIRQQFPTQHRFERVCTKQAAIALLMKQNPS